MADPRDDLADELDAFLAEHESFEEFVADADFAPIAPPDEAAVDRMLRRRRRLLNETARITEVAAAEIARIREWADDRRDGIDRQLVWLDRGCEMFMRQHNEATGRKSLPLPSGTLKLTAPGTPSVLVTDEPEFVTWCLLDDERDRFLRRTVSADKQEVRAAMKVGPVESDDGETATFLAVDADGEVVPGVRFTKPALARFSVAMPKPTVTPPGDDEQDTRNKEEQ